MNLDAPRLPRSSKKSRAAAAVFVITQDDIRRSPATNIPKLLRMVPAVQVAQINASTWAISVRGFNGEYNNKLLVLLDGRSVYLPATSGVFWDLLDVPLEDIDRIEVVRGAEGIRSAIASAPVAAANSEIAVAVSIGGTAGTSETEALANADTALYPDKSQGRNRCAVL